MNRREFFGFAAALAGLPAALKAIQKPPPPPLWPELAGYTAYSVIYRTAISDGDRQRVEGYLAEKWGMA